jgi:RNA polymerase sigma-70 factor (ECF subfamily)
MDERQEIQLIEQAQRGDARAFGKLALEHQRVLFNLALRMTKNREDARDLTQVVFLKAYRGLKGFDTRHRLFSWLYRIMLNEGLNFLSSRREHEAISDEMPGTQVSPEDEFDHSVISAAIQMGLQELNVEQRQVIILRHFLHLSYEDMGEVLEIPSKTVKSRLFTARQSLAPILQRLGVRPA